jgi:hypothetical protein
MKVKAIPIVGTTKVVFCDSVAILECGKRLIYYRTGEGLNTLFNLESYKNVTIDDSNVKWYDMLNWNELKETYETLPNHIKDDLIKSGKAPKEETHVDISYSKNRIKNERNLFYCPKCKSIAVTAGRASEGLKENFTPFHCQTCSFNWTIDHTEFKSGVYNKDRKFE